MDKGGSQEIKKQESRVLEAGRSDPHVPLLYNDLLPAVNDTDFVLQIVGKCIRASLGFQNC